MGHPEKPTRPPEGGRYERQASTFGRYGDLSASRRMTMEDPPSQREDGAPARAREILRRAKGALLRMTILAGSSRGLGDFAAFGGDHEHDELFGDFGLEAFGVSLLFADDVGDDATVLAVRVLHHLGGAGARQMSP
jgi:hypothetical protein